MRQSLGCDAEISRSRKYHPCESDVWPALSNRLERKAILEEISGRYSPEQIEEMLQHVSQRPYGFLFADLKSVDPDRMFQDSLLQYLRPSD